MDDFKMRTWDIIKRNSIIILILLNTTLLCYLNANSNNIPNSKVFTDISYDFHDSTPGFSHHSNYVAIHESTHDTLRIIQGIDDVNDSFEASYNQINPFLIRNESTGINTTIAILDSGINNNSWVSIREPRYTTITNSTKVTDDTGHGTIVAGIITKIAPNASLISIKVTNEDGLTQKKWVEDGLKLALSLNVSLIHISLELTMLAVINSTLIGEISSKNIPLIAPAGNYGPYGTSLTSPAIFPYAISVGMAYNQTHLVYDQAKPSKSSRGPRPSGIMGPDIVAPGTNIIGYNHNNVETIRNGTSFAASFVTGGIALLKESFPNISTSTLKAAILDSAKFMNKTSPTTQGNGFFDLSKTYRCLNNTDETHPLFIFAPRELSSYFTYFGHAINGVNRTYRISLYSTMNSTLSKVNITQTYPSYRNQTTNLTISHDFPIQISIDKLNEFLLEGFNILEVSLYIPQNLSMATRQGNVSFSFTYGANDSIEVSNLTITIENRYPGGNILFYQGYDNDSFIPNGPTGGFSQLQYFLELNYGIQSEGAIRIMDLISPVDPLFSTEKTSGGISQLDLEGQHILVLSDIELGISDQEITLINNWVLDGHSLLILSFPSQLINNTESLSNQTSINKLLEYYGITIENDSTDLSRFDNGTSIISERIFDNKELVFDYTGTSISISPEKGSRVLATAIDKSNEESATIAAYWEDDQSKGKVVVFGGLLPFIDSGVISSPNLNDNLQVIAKIFGWMIKDQQIPLEIQLTAGATKGMTTKIQISFDYTDFDSNFINATIVEHNGSFNQLYFLKKNSIFGAAATIFIAEWEPMISGTAILWLNLFIPGKVPTNGLYIIEVSDSPADDIFLLIILGGFILFGAIYFFFYSRQSKIRSPIEEKLALEFKKQKQQRKSKHYGLETHKICPQCQSPRYKQESRYCFNCGREL
jgi:hypothetical protein